MPKRTHLMALLAPPCVGMIALLAQRNALPSTVIGNGGDVIDRFLESGRSSFVSVIAALRDEGALTRVCEGVEGLDEAQELFCGTFFAQTANEVEGFNTSRVRVPFLLSPDRLYVTGVDGKPRAVLAVTAASPEGPVTFDADALRLLPPRSVVALIAHEFGHKARATDLDHNVTDVEPVGPFDAPDGGRRLLDALGEGVARVALARGYIGAEYGVNDGFHCYVDRSDVGSVASSGGFSPRLYLSQGDFNRYATGVGNRPRDFQCLFPHPRRLWDFALRVKVEENDGCAPGADAAGRRRTTISVTRSFPVAADGHARPDETVATTVLPGKNPLCEKKGAPGRALSIAFEDGGFSYRFELVYEGSYGDPHGVGFTHPRTMREVRAPTGARPQ